MLTAVIGMNHHQGNIWLSLIQWWAILTNCAYQHMGYKQYTQVSEADKMVSQCTQQGMVVC